MIYCTFRKVYRQGSPLRWSVHEGAFLLGGIVNTVTGELLTKEAYDELSDLEKADCILLEEDLTRQLTMKQIDRMQVSLKDTRSPGGKRLQEERKRRGLTRNQKKRLKRKGVIK